MIRLGSCPMYMHAASFVGLVCLVMWWLQFEPLHEKTNVLHMRKQRQKIGFEADQRLCFRYIDSTIPLLSKSKISSLLPSSVVVQPSLCGTWSETPKTGFLTTQLNLSNIPVTEDTSSLLFSSKRTFLMIKPWTGAIIAQGPPSCCTRAVFSCSLNTKPEGQILERT